MKNFLTIVASVLLSVLAVWFLLPEMQKYYAQKGMPDVTVTQQQPAPKQLAQTSTTQKKSSKTKTAQKTTKQQAAKQTSNDKNALTVKSVSLDSFYTRYSLQNNTNQTISDVRVRIIFYNKNGDQIHYEDESAYGDIAPGLTKSFDEIRTSEAKGATGATVQVLSYKYK